MILFVSDNNKSENLDVENPYALGFNFEFLIVQRQIA